MENTTANKAAAMVKRFPLVHVVWHKKDCPVCEHFIPDLEELSELLPNWRFFKVDADEHKELTETVLWEPTAFPISYLFVEGQRKFVAIGAAPMEAILDTHNSIENGTWKTPEEVEQEQIDASSEQE